ncbi:MAG: trypsin-like peptidase domain-containing protein [Thermoanaerobaculia bacterium]
MLSMTALAVVAAGGCATEAEPGLEGVQKMAYLVRPAVVRVRAYATATFTAPPPAIARVDAEIARRGLAGPARGAPITVETGAGGSGSGFIVHPDGAILTSGHVVALIRDPAAVQRELLRNGAVAVLLARYPIDVLRALHRDGALVPLLEEVSGAGSLRDIRTFREIDLSNGERAAFSIVEFSPSLAQRGDDVALLRIDRHDLPTLRLGSSGSVHVQETIWVVGYPAVASTSDDMVGGWLSQETDLESTMNSGSITSIKRNVADVPVFQTDVPIYRGNSGGPAVNARGEVIGMATWGHATADAIKFLVPIDVARPYLERQRIDLTEQGSFTPAYEAALAAAESGGWSAAVRDLRRANDEFPGNPDIARLLGEAEVAARRQSRAWRARAVPTALTVVALAGVGTASTIALRRRRRRRTLVGTEPPPGETRVVLPSREPRSDGLIGRLTILNGSRAGERLGLGGSGIRIGRELRQCEIVLHDPKVSRLHAEIVRLDGRVLLIDRNSSNGTWVNDRKIDREYLKDGDIIYFGGRNAVAAAFHE